MNMKQIRGFYLMTLAAGLLCFGWPFGIDASAANQNPCSEDVARFCANIPPGPAGMMALMDCLEEHEKELSDACKNFETGMGGPRMEKREAVREKMQFRQSCMGDIARFCNDASPMQGGMMKCLNDHESELSAPCIQSIKAMMMK
jgi:Cysteine rich repeat